MKRALAKRACAECVALALAASESAAAPLPPHPDVWAALGAYMAMFGVVFYLAFWVGLAVLVYKFITRFFQLCRDVADIKQLLARRGTVDREGNSGQDRSPES
jgi:H+/gluconate symporter-like permease